MATTHTAHETRFAEAWRANRSYLVDMAFGMLGNIAAAEDAVQEAFARLAGTNLDEIEEVRGWLIVVTSRICLDHIRAASSRREEPRDTSTIELAGGGGAPAPVMAATTPAPPDPADRVTLDDEVRLALLVVLQRLSPIERVVFVLHDVFRMPFDAVAETVGRSAPTCRQVARRARLKMAAQADSASPGGGRVAVDAAEHQEVAKQFIRACANGDLDGLLQILDPSVWGDVDLGPLDARSGQVRHGAPAVATNLLRFVGRFTMVSNPIGGHTIVLAFSGQRLLALVLLTIENGLVRQIHVLADPEKLVALDSQLIASAPGAAAG
jgi:RNA polymerase sigma-70 factor (ECF subfamily)